MPFTGTSCKIVFMLAALGTLALLASNSGVQNPAPVLDLFLVARNEWRVDSIGWFDKKGSEGAETVFRSRLQELDTARKPYLIFDGGSCPLFPKWDEWKVTQTSRYVKEYDAFVEVSKVRGVEKRKVISRGVASSAAGASISVQPPIEKPYYTNQHYCYPFGFDPSKPGICMRDLNGYRKALTAEMEQDRAGLDRTIIFSTLPIDQTRQFFRDQKVNFEGVCISQSGLPQRDAPNFIAFPPSGVIAHYALTHDGARWNARLVDYLTAPDGTGRNRTR